MEIKEINNNNYFLMEDKLTFDTDVGDLEMTKECAYKIAMTLFDSLGLDYGIATLQDVEEKIYFED